MLSTENYTENIIVLLRYLILSKQFILVLIVITKPDLNVSLLDHLDSQSMVVLKQAQKTIEKQAASLKVTHAWNEMIHMT